MTFLKKGEKVEQSHKKPTLSFYFFLFFRSNLMRIGDNHIKKSMDYVIGSDYVGSHWLASFLTHSLLMREKALLKDSFDVLDMEF